MSLKGGPASSELIDYVIDRFCTAESELLARMWKPAEKAGIPMIMIAPEQARFLGLWTRVSGSRRVLDVGTLFGYSAATMALAMGPEGRVVTVERESKHAAVAKANFESLGLRDRVQTIVAPALEALQRMEPRSFDGALVDADKANYERYLDECLRLVRPGGWVAFDNAFAFGRLLDDGIASGDADGPDVAAIRGFNEALARHPRVDSVIVPMGDGLALGVVREQAAPGPLKGGRVKA